MYWCQRPANTVSTSNLLCRRWAPKHIGCLPALRTKSAPVPSECASSGRVSNAVARSPNSIRPMQVCSGRAIRLSMGKRGVRYDGRVGPGATLGAKLRQESAARDISKVRNAALHLRSNKRVQLCGISSQGKFVPNVVQTPSGASKGEFTVLTRNSPPKFASEILHRIFL
jgi:hypothetical protein